MVIAGDTVPCAGLNQLLVGADVYVQTVIRRSLVQAVPAPRLQDILDYHSGVEEAAATAQRAGVSTLVLTHLVPAPWPGTEHEWADEARAIFSGEVVVAEDPLRTRGMREPTLWNEHRSFPRDIGFRPDSGHISERRRPGHDREAAGVDLVNQ